MANYDFTRCLSPIDFELLSKDILEAELGITLENFSEGRDNGIDLRYAPRTPDRKNNKMGRLNNPNSYNSTPDLIVQCKRYSKFSDLKSTLARKELPKVTKLAPSRYILTTSVSLSPLQCDEICNILAPFIQSTDDIYGSERLNSLLSKHIEVERRHIKLWATSTTVLESILHPEIHRISKDEIDSILESAKIYVKNRSFNEAIEILKTQRVCIISGIPGIGKTTLARMLLLYFYRKNYSIIKITSDISEAYSVPSSNRPRVYYYDDFLGQTAQADKLNKNEDQKLLEFIASVRRSKDSIFILTTREYILNQAKLNYEKLSRENFDKHKCTVDISKYTRLIRGQILYNHLHFSNLPAPYINSMLKNKGYLRIIDHKNYNPRIISYLTNPDWLGSTNPASYLDLFLSKLNNPVDIWDHAFRNQLSAKSINLLFTLTTLPQEILFDDLNSAFTTHHKYACESFNQPHSERDFVNALKELDGTFISLRKISHRTTIHFQNPSIRDFMQHLLLGGESLNSILNTLTFFEQVHWFAKKLNEHKKMTERQPLQQNTPTIIQSAKKLIHSKSCSIHVGVSHIEVIKENIASRLAAIVELTFDSFDQIDHDWITSQVTALNTMLLSQAIKPFEVIDSIEQFDSNGLLNLEAGTQLLDTLKTLILKNPKEIDDYENILQLINIKPTIFTENEYMNIYANFIRLLDRIPHSHKSLSPEELRTDADRIEAIGNTLDIDTNDIQDLLFKLADEIERSEEDQYEEEDEDFDDHEAAFTYHPSGCTDTELDSIFNTLDTSIS